MLLPLPVATECPRPASPIPPVNGCLQWVPPASGCHQWVPASECPPVGGTSGWSQWALPVGGASGCPQWVSPVDGASGRSQWVAPVDAPSGWHQWVSPVDGASGRSQWVAPVGAPSECHRPWHSIYSTDGNMSLTLLPDCCLHNQQTHRILGCRDQLVVLSMLIFSAALFCFLQINAVEI